VLDPALPRHWRAGQSDPEFPRITAPPPGGMTAWYSMRLTDLGEDCEDARHQDLDTAIQEYETRDAARVHLWNETYSSALT